MPPRKELCRNFQRGSCQYGDRCKFLHATSQPSKPNPFGFGMQNGNQIQQQQMPNPFGFGIQNNRGDNNAGSKQPNKPFENKWTRSSTTNNNSGFAALKPGNQQPATSHTCTDPETCRRFIVEDLQKEKPLWKLTCYGHGGNGPCDISGDISYEELRALAYDDAKQGKSLQLIVDRERSLVNSKLDEFQNLIQQPYNVPNSAATPSTQNPFPGGITNPPVANNAVSPPASSFSQLNASLNIGSAAAAPNYSFGQSSAFQTNSQPSTMFQTNTSSPFNNTSGAFGSQLPQRSVQSSFPFGSANPPSNNAISASKNPFSTFGNSPQAGDVSHNKFGSASNVNNSQSTDIQPSGISTDNLPKENTNTDSSIWTKANWKWNAGEIPEDAPPDIYIH